MTAQATLKRLAKTAVASLAARAGPHRRDTTTPRLWVLMYHRILPGGQAVAESEEPGMFVTPETFARQLAWLRDTMPVVRLGDWVAQAKSGEPLTPRACAITFDDGWLDNYQHAFPALRSAGVSATIFVVSKLLGTAGDFWPSRLARLLEQHREFCLQHDAMAWLRNHLTSSGTDLGAASQTEDGRSAVIAVVKALPDPAIEAHLDAAEAQLTIERGPRRMLNTDELREMVDSGVFDVGSHTRLHTRLREGVSTEVVRQEVVESRRDLEALLGVEVPLFCYPNGDYTPQVAELVGETYQAAVTTQRGINGPGSPLAELKRIGVHEDIGATRRDFLARLSGWV